MNKKISKANNKVFLFGAGLFSQYLISFGLRTENIEYILDNSLSKQNKRLYGTNLIVKSPKILSSIDKAHVILKAHTYNQEIIDDIINQYNNKVEFWT